MMKKFHVAGYPAGHIESESILIAANSAADALEKAVDVLRLRGCEVDAATLSASEDKPRLLERWP